MNHVITVFPRMRRRGVEEFAPHQPEMFIVSNICGQFGRLQGLDFSKASPEEVEDNVRAGAAHLKCCISICKMQVDRARHFMLEHPINAQSWVMGGLREAMQFPGVMAVDFDFCQFNMKSDDYKGEALAKNRTRAMTNSVRFAKRLLTAQCPKDRRCVPFINSRVGPCQACSDECSDDICKAINEEVLDKQIQN